MNQLKIMKENLTAAIQTQLMNLQSANTAELGMAMDMLKDLSEAMYYCSIVEAMEEEKKTRETDGQNQQQRYYGGERFREPPYYRYPDRDIDRPYNRMYYPGDGTGGGTQSSSSRGNGSSSSSGHGSSGTTRNYSEMIPRRMPDDYIMNRNAKNHKDKHHDDKEELEDYMEDLAEDLTELIEDASVEERQKVHDKLAKLAEKIK